ncbi:MAG TPA: gamma carbonic anhydrase family protein [Smithella sp.]|nr:gamma carbonic anhydrase family protein [Smithella sp.]
MPLYELEGRKPRIPEDAFVHPQAVLIGDVRVGHECLIAPGVSIRADFGPVTIGDRSNVQDNSVIHVSPGSRVVIEEEVIVAHGVLLHDVHIRSRCVIGMGAVLLFGAVCEEDAFVAAGSVVPKGAVVPAAKLAAGNPAVITREISEGEKQMAREGVEYYRDLCRKYLATLKKV